jgi:hypothetical protein
MNLKYQFFTCFECRGNMMRPFLLILLLAFHICSCRNSGESPDEKPTDSVAESRLLVWQIDYDHKTKSKNPFFSGENPNADSLISALNDAYPQIQLKKLRISGDTLYAKIEDAYFLTEGMGSYGAAAYIAEAIINLTSVNHINYVNIDFENGTHLAHRTWSKDEFGDYTVP